LGEDIYNKIFQLEILGPQDVNALFWVRWVTALFGVGVVWGSYLVGKKLFGKLTGLITAMLVCVNYRQVLNSHLGLPDIYNTFTFLLSFWAILHLREKVNFSRVLLCGIFLGLHLSTKYQFFPFFALFLVYLEKSWQKQNLKAKISSFFNPYLLVIPVISLLVFLLLNPYLIINLETALSQLSYASLKYGVGRMKLFYYPYWYLFNIGVGKITSFVIIGGILVGIFKERWKSVLLLSVIIPFFYFMTIYSSGGFYTRNLISITPFLLIFAAYTIWQLLNVKPQKFLLPIAIVILSLAVWENLSKSLIILKEYTKPWNRELIEEWMINNIPKGSVVAAHSSVPVPEGRIRIVYDRWPWPYFSLAEFQEAGAQYAVANLDWISVDFYNWMRSIKSWNKPLSEMRQTYTALTIDELSDFGLHQEINSWQAPDLDFIVAKVPYYSIFSREKVKSFNLDDTLPLTQWKSEPVAVDGWSGFEIEYRIKIETQGKDYKDGVIVIKFYPNMEEALSGRDHVAVRLSARDDMPDCWVDKKLIGKIPGDAKYAVLGFKVYDANAANYFLDKIELYKADVLEDLGGAEIKKIRIDDNNLFPNSGSNL